VGTPIAAQDVPEAEAFLAIARRVAEKLPADSIGAVRA
jgi:hypothetical protein